MMILKKNSCKPMSVQKVLSSLLAICLAASSTISCVHKSPTSASNAETVAVTNEDGTPIQPLQDVSSFRLTDPEGPKVVDEELEQIPTEINPLVEKWIAYFQGRGRPHMERYLSRSTRYMKLMKKILRDNGLPEDLVYIALIESGFSPKATSRAAAVGYWQFIRGTGKRYGMEISTMVDERRDPILSTQAAAEYFKGLYSVFGSWYLAMASYNVGENRVKKEVMKAMTRDFWVLAHKRRLPKETVNYIPKFIAAKLIGNDPAKYGFTEIDYMTPIEFEHITVDKPVNLKMMAEKMDMEYDDLKQLNPKFKGEVAPLKANGKLELRVPIGAVQTATIAAAAAAVEKVEYIADAGEVDVYKVKRGDSLFTIARKYRTTVAWIRDQNDLKKGKKLRVGQRIFVPDLASKREAKLVAKKTKPQQPSSQPTAVATAESAAELSSLSDKSIEKSADKTAEKSSDEKATSSLEVVTAKGVFYIVQPGDTLIDIADDYNSSVEELRKMNKMSKGSILRAGMRLKVPKDEGLPADPNEGKPGDSNDSVASKENDTQSNSSSAESREPQQDRGVGRVADLRAPQSTKSAAQNSSLNNHVVKAGENLTTIAKKYGVSIMALRKANNLSKRATLKVGAEIKIPSEARPQTINKTHSMNSQKKIVRVAKKKIHIVKRGENLTQIADRYNVELSDLRRENRGLRGSKLFIGSRLLIPSAHAN